eukprot:TRINITY_DN1469_c0_g1_i7.p1 TRINITY_DN1469_c0_g1~~TRINITY_DN1469_c0_g1_i7.p1  ORF type:complete len:149 (-),score=0.22 TRINITY_DN1469_c0_g1_i7:3-449(-)
MQKAKMFYCFQLLICKMTGVQVNFVIPANTFLEKIFMFVPILSSSDISISVFCDGMNFRQRMFYMYVSFRQGCSVYTAKQKIIFGFVVYMHAFVLVSYFRYVARQLFSICCSGWVLFQKWIPNAIPRVARAQSAEPDYSARQHNQSSL